MPAAILRLIARRGRSQAEAWARQFTLLKHKPRVLQDKAVPGPPFRVWTEARRWLAPCTTLRLFVGPSVIRAAVLQRDGPDWAAECTWDSETDLTDAIARLAAELPQPCRRVTVTLERPLVQLRTIRDLPPVRAGMLPALVAGQDRRFFRRNGRALVTDAVWVGANGARVARAAAVDQLLVEAIAEGARAAGLELTAVTPADSAAALSLLPSAVRNGRARVARRRVRRLAITTATVWLVAGALFAGRLTWERRRVETALAAADAPVAAVRAARRELRAAEAAVAALRATEAGRGRALATLGAIARALPDSVAVTSLVWSADGSGVIGGVGPRAGDAVAALARAHAVSRPRLEGPVARENVAGREGERFTIVFGARDEGRGRGRDR